MPGQRVIAIVSGGPDSFCTLVYWLSRGYDALVLFFDYGQRANRRELATLRELLDALSRLSAERGWGIVEELITVDLSFMKNLWRGTQLTDENTPVTSSYDKTIVVPLRNTLMTTIATAYAYSLVETRRLDKAIVVLGSQYDDVKPRDDTWEPRYPDCSPECFQALETALRICHFRDTRDRVEIWAPSKAMMRKDTLLKTCYSLVGDLLYKTWSCYQDHEKHCGKCESCINRKNAFRQAGLPDKTEYES